ncbi:MAG: putative DNA-binding protein [Gemmatimonadetes bacterium]|nr:putative DNA-binding protein [Gemmatimonadota bacterium]
MQIAVPKDLGIRMRDQRLSLRISQASLARSVGVSRSWVIKVERGNPGAEVGLVLKALRALDLTVDVRPGSSSVTPGDGSGGIASPDLAAILERARGTAP